MGVFDFPLAFIGGRRRNGDAGRKGTDEDGLPNLGMYANDWKKIRKAQICRDGSLTRGSARRKDFQDLLKDQSHWLRIHCES
jgi:hypothetical protein